MSQVTFAVSGRTDAVQPLFRSWPKQIGQVIVFLVLLAASSVSYSQETAGPTSAPPNATSGNTEDTASQA